MAAVAKTARDIGRRPRGQLAAIDYTLAKRAILREARRGVVSVLDLCDAHPELMRAARNVGEELASPCPVCRGHSLRRLAYVYADELRHDNARVWTMKEALALTARCQNGACYVVEVCLDCCWNHLSEAFVARSAG